MSMHSTNMLKTHSRHLGGEKARAYAAYQTQNQANKGSVFICLKTASIFRQNGYIAK